MIKTIHISVKHDDRYAASFIDEDGHEIANHNGYGLYIDGLDGGDYTRLTIDNETGNIVGWIPLATETLTELLEE